VQINEHSRELLAEVPRTRPPFIVLENLFHESQQAQGLHVVSLAGSKALKLGRGLDNDVRIADVSISRCHSMIRFERGSFILDDLRSRFGTSVAIRKPLQLQAGVPVSIQMGPTVLFLEAQTDPHSSSSSAGMELNAPKERKKFQLRIPELRSRRPIDITTL
jgi:hypothetical protein